MNHRYKKFFKKFIPKFLQPLAYKIYSYALFYLRNKVLTKKFVNEIVQITSHLEIESFSVHILQPTFYNLDGTTYLSGGAERYLCDLCQILIELDYKPLIIQFGNKNWYIKHDNIDVLGISCAQNIDIFNLLAHDSKLGNPKLTIYSPFILANNKFNRKFSIGISHGIFWDHPYGNALTKSIKSSYKNIHKLVSVDTTTINWFRSSLQSIVNNKKMQYVPNYVDINLYKPSNLIDKNNKIKILYPRRLYAQRGYYLVQNIIPQLLSEYPNIEFHFVGQAEQDTINDVESLMNTYPDNIHFYQQKAEDMHLIYQKIDITLIPTIASEGTSLSCLEAMACGNVVIATNVGGLSNLIIDNYNGILIEPYENELINAIRLVLKNKNLRSSLSFKAIEVAQCFNKKAWQESWINIIKSID